MSVLQCHVLMLIIDLSQIVQPALPLQERFEFSSALVSLYGRCRHLEQPRSGPVLVGDFATSLLPLFLLLLFLLPDPGVVAQPAVDPARVRAHHDVAEPVNLGQPLHGLNDVFKIEAYKRDCVRERVWQV